jgi:hypothetical protein
MALTGAKPTDRVILLQLADGDKPFTMNIGEDVDLEEAMMTLYSAYMFLSMMLDTPKGTVLN